MVSHLGRVGQVEPGRLDRFKGQIDAGDLVLGTTQRTEDDHVVSRAQLIKDVTTGSDTVVSGRNEDLTVRVYGNAAVATGWLIVQGRGPSGPSEVRYRYTDTWAKLGGRWRIVAAHDYKKP